MKIVKWGSSLALRLPASVVAALALKAGDEVHIQQNGEHTFTVEKITEARKLLAQLRKYRGRVPANFVFDRLAANTRDER